MRSKSIIDLYGWECGLQAQKHIAQGKAKRHPGYKWDSNIRPERAKALKVQEQLRFCPFRATSHTHRLVPGWRFALPWAMFSLPLQGVSLSSKYRFALALLAMLTTLTLKAQTDAPNDSVQLQEVVVRGARVVNRTDGKILFPSVDIKTFQYPPLENGHLH